MSQNKTQKTKESVFKYLNSIEDKQQRGKGCLCIKTLGDINTDVLRQIMNLEATVK